MKIPHKRKGGPFIDRLLDGLFLHQELFGVVPPFVVSAFDGFDHIGCAVTSDDILLEYWYKFLEGRFLLAGLVAGLIINDGLKEDSVLVLLDEVNELSSDLLHLLEMLN